MKRTPIRFLQIIILLIGIGAFAFLLWEPHLEGRNAQATPFEIYFKDPFLAFVYVASIPFFTALYQAFQMLGRVGQNKVFSPANVKALRTIKYCALAVIGFVVISVAFLPFGDPDDRPPGVMMRVVVVLGSIVIVAAAALFEQIVNHAVDTKSENDRNA